MSRRRGGRAALQPQRLLTPPVAPYPISEDADPVAVLAAWRSAYDVWVSERAAWVTAGGVWPGGEDQRVAGEAAVTPDEPYEPPRKVPAGDDDQAAGVGGQQT